MFLPAPPGNEGQNITMPDGIRRDQFLHWVESLSDRQTPSWLGLPNNAEKVLLTTRGKSPHLSRVLSPWSSLLAMFHFTFITCLVKS